MVLCGDERVRRRKGRDEEKGSEEMREKGQGEGREGECRKEEEKGGST